MKIIASKRDEILERKAEYEARKAAYDSRQIVNWCKYTAAQNEVLYKIEATITNLLSDLDLLKLKVQALPATVLKRGVSITITCSTGPLR